jgi:CHAT domain-containing protein
VLVSFGDEEIDASLGHSIIYEECRGNFADANRLTESRLKLARKQLDRDNLVAALLARGAAHMLSFNLKTADACFTESAGLVSGSPDLELRIGSFKKLCAQLRFNLSPTQAGMWTSELEIRWDRRTYTAQFEERRKQLEPQISSAQALSEVSLTDDLLGGFLAQRNIAELGDGQTGPIQQLLGPAGRSVLDFQDAARKTSPGDSSIAYGYWTMANLCRLARQQGLFANYLQVANQAYTETDDRIGMANCRMLWSDSVIAPFSHPLAWDCAVRDSGTQASDLAWTVEVREMRGEATIGNSVLGLYAEAEALYSEAGAMRGVAAISLRRAYLAVLANHYDQAIQHTQDAIRNFAETEDWLGYWAAQCHRLLAQVGNGLLPEDIETARAIGKWGADDGSFSYALGLGILFGRLGRYWLVQKGDYEKSLACHRLARAVYDALGCSTNSAQSLTDFAVVHQAIGSTSAALTWYDEAIAAYDSAIETMPAQAANLRGRQISIVADTYLLALRVMDVEAMDSSTKRLESLIKTLPEGDSQLAQLVEKMHQFQAALQSGQVLDLPVDLLQSWVFKQYANTLLAQARVCVPLYKATRARDNGDEAQTENYFAAALEAADSAGSEADILRALVLATAKKYSDAIVAFQRYEKSGGPQSGIIGDLMAIINTGGAERSELENKKLKQRQHDLAFTFYIRTKAYEDARNELNLLIDVAGEDWWKGQERPWMSLSSCAELYENLGQFETAIRFHAMAVSEFELRREQISRDDFKTSLAGEFGAQAIFFRAARTAMSLRDQALKHSDTSSFKQYSALVFDYSERGRARALLDLMAGARALGEANKAEGTAMRRWRELTARLAVQRELSRMGQQHAAGQLNNSNPHLSELISSGEEELSQIEKELAAVEPGFYSLINPQASLLSLEQIAEMLSEETAILQYYFLEDSLLAWAIDRSGITVAKAITMDTKILTRDAAAFHHACARGDDIEQPGLDLATRLLEPLAEAIDKCSKLLICPYGALHLLPFHILPWLGQPLVSQRQISYLPSANTMPFVSRATESETAERLLAIGNPANMSWTPPFEERAVPQPSLRWADVEAGYVASMFRKGIALTEQKAQKEEIRAQIPHFPLLHFATHGVLWEQAPLASAILLANGESFSLYELMGMDLGSELIVLSACDSGRGETTGGDDVLGLVRGLLAAGARAAVVSLWPVDDFSTCLLMGKFYDEYRATGNAAAALKKAQNYLRTCDSQEIDSERKRLGDLFGQPQESGAKAPQSDPLVEQSRHLFNPQALPVARDYQHPRFWAPFIVVGF